MPDAKATVPSTIEKFLRALLLVIGAGLMVAVIPIFFPATLMAYFHERLGLGDFPNQPITLYLARSTSLLYAIHGFVMLYTALHFSKLKDLVPVLGWIHFAAGVFMLGIDISAEMPWYWTIGEGPGVAAMGLGIVWLANKMQNAAIEKERRLA